MATLSSSTLVPNTLFSSFPSSSRNVSSLPVLHFRPNRNTLSLTLSASKHPPATSETNASINVETFAPQNNDNSTAFVIRARNRIGLLQVITRVFNVLGLRIDKATVDFEGDYCIKTFFVTDSRGNMIHDEKGLESIKKALVEALDVEVEDDVAVSVDPAARGIMARKPLLEFRDGKGKAERMFELMDVFLKNDPVTLQKDILDHVEYTVAKSRFSFDDFEAYQALAHSVRDRLIERWHDTQIHFYRKNPKRLYFLSLEFLMGRSLSNSVINLGIRDQFADALSQLGDACLGNGGLARLSACQMDSLATLDYPAIGYGLRYQYGLFRQVILDGFQHEQPDYWLNFGNPWEIERVHITYPVKFYGTVTDEVLNKEKIKVWVPGEMVEAVAYDNPIPGYGTRNTIVLRLWAAKPSDELNMVISKKSN
ncbi:hypothetical protein F3Y22_tig00112206pilonHSYRG00382 [Hibiscus syriacus]|uniref:Alpha-1,4 glucan phosphorylase n=1 Tax=Hibiscus syriacus TaxID=106335 RepID=A0A6A2Y3E4_HIBSY|nr:hypothetical protein F3Y22_tig00112206pilonHSYRG00382 [Hibiscus syriacus]